MGEREDERWTEFDRKRYCETGPHKPDGMRFDGLVVTRDDAGHESIDWFYTRLIGGFENQRITHWRHIQPKDLARLLRIESAAKALLDNVDTAIADGVSTELKEALRLALRSGEREGGS